MIKNITIDEICEDLTFYKSEILNGKIFAFHTDSVLGFGVSPISRDFVLRLANLKCRDSNKPFLVMPPSVDWVYENCFIEEKFESLMKNLWNDGRSSVVLKYLGDVLCEGVCLSFEDYDTLGLRFSNDRFSVNVLRKLNLPFISSSLNYSGEKNIEVIDEIPESILNEIDYVVLDEFESLENKPSKIYDLTGKEIKRLR